MPYRNKDFQIVADDRTPDRQLQTGKSAGPEGYNGMLDCFRKIIKNEGTSRLYRGISAPILMEAPKRYILSAVQWFYRR